VGVRRLLQDEPLEFFEDPGLLEGLRALAASGLPFDACIRHHQLPALTTLLGKVPDLRVVLDHLAKPPVAEGDDGTWERNLRLLAGLPQVSVKLSGMPPEFSGDQVLADARPWLEVTLDAFGADRSMVASDWPVSAVTAQKVLPGEWISMVLDDLGANDAERESLAWRTASTFYGV
jgi:L-fuconolactonase